MIVSSRFIVLLLWLSADCFKYTPFRLPVSMKSRFGQHRGLRRGIFGRLGRKDASRVIHASVRGARSDAPIGNSRKVAIIGAGISGAACAHALLRENVDTTIFERSSRVGGRAGTWRNESQNRKGTNDDADKQDSPTVQFDLGTQYISPKSTEFASTLRSWQEEGLVKLWKGRVATIEGKIKTEPAGVSFNMTKMEPKLPKSPRYVGDGGMDTLVKGLIGKIPGGNINLSTRIVRVERDADSKKWHIYGRPVKEGTESTEEVEEVSYGEYDVVIGSCRSLFEEGGVFSNLSALDSEFKQSLDSVQPSSGPARSFSIGVVFDKAIPDIGFDAALVSGTRSLSWFCRESSKRADSSEGVNSEKKNDCWVLQSNTAISDFCREPNQVKVFSLADNDLKDYLIFAIQYRMIDDFLAVIKSTDKGRTMPESLYPTKIHLKEWVDGLPGKCLNHPKHCVASKDLGLIACGDYCSSGPRIEDAVNSGFAAANVILKDLM